MAKNIRPVFLCELPPPYGGVTVKNQLIIDKVEEYGRDLKVIDLYECKRHKLHAPGILLQMLWAFMTRREIIYGFGSHKRLNIAVALQAMFGGKVSLRRTQNIVMGGTYQNYAAENSVFCKRIANMKKHYVETEGMKDALRALGVPNVSVFPNPKSSEGCCPPRKRAPDEPLRLVFFSQISREKGVADIMELVKLLDQDGTIPYTLDFYGHVVPDFKEEFEAFLPASNHVRYCGVFDSAKDNVYQKLNEYDVLLFPTRWEGEGVPGILVEAKMAGLAVIASRQNFNAELVREDQQEGILLDENYAEEMFQAILLLHLDSMKLQTIQNASYTSRKRFSLEEYMWFFETF